MGATVNNNTTNNYNFFFNLNNGFQANDACNALNAINSSPWFQQDSLSVGQGWGANSNCMCNCGWVPPPQVGSSGAPAGRGLRDVSGQNGWPANTTETAGGYHIIANGGTKFQIFNPGQCACDKPAGECSGDPHFNWEGKNYDFTGTCGSGGNGLDLQLGDGTKLFAQTSSNQGRSVTT